MDNYENRLRVSLVGIARAKFERVAKVSALVDTLEDKIFNPKRLDELDTDTLVKIWAQGHKVMKDDLTYINKVTEMRLRGLALENLAGLGEGEKGEKVLLIGGKAIELPASAVDRVLKIFGGLKERDDETDDG